MMHIAILCFLVLSCRYEVHSLLSTHGNDVEQLKQLVQQMNVSLQHVLAENQKLNAEINGLKNLTSQVAASSTGRGSLAFTAILSNDKEFAHHQSVVFDKILLNHGNAYNGNLGHFRATSSGFYQFTVSYLNIGKTSFFQLFKNGNQALASDYLDVGKNYSSSSTIAVQLDKGDVVFVKTESGLHPSNLRGSDNCIFSGFLVQKT
ncbi:complement C1q subcomponent subunit A-like isoform X3 [Saccostrea cucullata]|uniref:complement C1q subcomponent subunit A-like isoform X3 n=1 Tax=Saccostrea cuccullata TaxID=36930 RepID=UPI002ED1F5E0